VIQIPVALFLTVVTPTRRFAATSPLKGEVGAPPAPRLTDDHRNHQRRDAMGAQKGKDLLLKVEDGAGFVTVAGLRARRLAFNAQSVDVTDSESAGRWRELLEGAGVRRAGLTGSGLFKDAASDALIRAAFFAGSILTYQVVIPDFGTVTAPFQVTALDYGGNHDGEVTFEIALESAGAVSFAAL